MEKVVITGMGAVSPFGVGKEILWESLLAGKNGISKIKGKNIKGDIVGIGGSIPAINYEKYYNLAPQLEKNVPEDENVKSFFLAVAEAINESGLNFESMESTDRVGSFIADRAMGPAVYIDEYISALSESSNGKEFNREEFYSLLKENPVPQELPFDDYDSINHYTSRVYNITGPQLSIGTACASGNNAIGEAFRKIQKGSLDIVICGGAFNFEITGMMGFTRIGALTTNPDPDIACSPFDQRRSGFVMGSGCGILILESLTSAQKRGALILAELSGYGSVSDGYRATDPDPEASGATRTMMSALESSGLNPSDISYINAHGTSTKMNDLTETRAIKKVFKDSAYSIPVSSTKSMIGHSIMATGGIESIVSVLSIRDSIIHQTRNWEIPDNEMDLDYTPNSSRKMNVDHVLSNNFGFGGQNATLIFSKHRA